MSLDWACETHVTRPRTPSVITTDPYRAQPWEVGDANRPALLRWFLDADLTSREEQELLVDLTARRGALSSDADRRLGQQLIARGVAAKDVIYPGREWGGWKIGEVVSRSDFARIYADLQRYLREARMDWVSAKKASGFIQLPDGSRIPERELLAMNAAGRFRQERADITLDWERDPDTGAIVWPQREETPRQVRRTASLAGELALAMYDELSGAKRAGLCAQCGRPWFFKVRRKRRLCGDENCAKEWMRAHRSREDPARVYLRVKKYRAAQRAKSKSKSKSKSRTPRSGGGASR